METSGIDLELTWTWRTGWGSWTPLLSATWIDRYEAVDVPDGPSIDRVGRASLDGTITRWRGVGTLAWAHGAWSASLSARYTPSYDDYDPIAERLTGTRLDAQTLVDAQAALDLGELFDASGWWWGGTKLSAGVVNLFDEVPQFAWVGISTGYDISQGDLRQRFAYLQLSKQF